MIYTCVDSYNGARVNGTGTELTTNTRSGMAHIIERHAIQIYVPMEGENCLQCWQLLFTLDYSGDIRTCNGYAGNNTDVNNKFAFEQTVTEIPDLMQAVKKYTVPTCISDDTVDTTAQMESSDAEDDECSTDGEKVQPECRADGTDDKVPTNSPTPSQSSALIVNCEGCDDGAKMESTDSVNDTLTIKAPTKSSGLKRSE
uniref:Uncharacterized protein n=2 Tax=Lygus hesperus TaxID=30085 RepID=A0A146M4P5_LYGHE